MRAKFEVSAMTAQQLARSAADRVEALRIGWSCGQTSSREALALLEVIEDLVLELDRRDYGDQLSLYPVDSRYPETVQSIG